MQINYDNESFGGVNSFITSKFCDIFPTYDDFKGIYDEVPEGFNVLNSKYLQLTYYLLYGRFGNSTIANTDTNQFIYRLASIIYQYGPLWEKETEIQKYVRNLTTKADGSFDITAIKAGTKVIMNSAMNPGTEPSTSALDELQYINNQNTTNYKKDDLKAISDYIMTLSTDPTDVYLGRFKTLFLTIVEGQNNVIFE